MQINNGRLDILRFISIIGVIVIHCDPSVTLFKIEPDNNWWIGNFYGSLSRFCVPMFVMISGALILPKEYTLGEFLRRRFMRIIPPFAFWTAVFIAFNCFEKHLFNSGVFKFIALSVLNGAFFHLWFIYMLVGVYLIAPIISKWLKQAGETEVQYFLGLWLLGLLFNLPLLNKVGLRSTLINFEAYIGYFVLGHYLSVKNFRVNNIKLIAACMFLTGFLFTFFGTYLWSVHQRELSPALFDFKTINICLMTAGIFIFLKNWEVNLTGTAGVFISLISKYSFGVYFIHPLIIAGLEKINIHVCLTSPLWGVPITVLIVLLISVLILKVMRFLPWGRHLTGVVENVKAIKN